MEEIAFDYHPMSSRSGIVDLKRQIEDHAPLLEGPHIPTVSTLRKKLDHIGFVFFPRPSRMVDK